MYLTIVLLMAQQLYSLPTFWEIVEKICDRYLVLKNGKIIADLTADSLKKDVVEEQIDLETYVLQLLKASK